jgi:ankyrin repeat protein
MKLAMFVFTLLIMAGCGKHDIQNFGYTKETSAAEGDKPTTPADFIKLAIEQNDRAAFEKILSAGYEVNTILKNGRTALIHSVYNQNAFFAYELIKKGADVSLTDSDGKTALDVAVDLEQGRIELMLNPEKQAEKQRLLIAALRNDGDNVDPEVNALLKDGTDPNFTVTAEMEALLPAPPDWVEEAPVTLGETPLTLALKVKSLATGGLVSWSDPGFGINVVDVNLPNAAGEMPLTLAKKNKGPKAKKIIEDLINKNATETPPAPEAPEVTEENP